MMHNSTNKKSMEDIDISVIESNFEILHSDYVSVVKEVLKGGNLKDVRFMQLLQDKGVSGRKEMVKALMDIWAAVKILKDYRESIIERLKTEKSEDEIKSLSSYRRLIEENLNFLIKGEQLFIPHVNMVDHFDCLQDRCIHEIENVKEDLKVTNQDAVEAAHDHGDLKDAVAEIREEVKDLKMQLGEAYKMIKDLKERLDGKEKVESLNKGAAAAS